MSNQFVSIYDATDYDLVGTIALWQKETSRGDAYLGGTLTIGGREGGTKLFISLYPQENESVKAVLKGSVTTKVGDEYVKMAWVSVFKSSKGEEDYYGYVNPNPKVEGTERLSFVFKLFRNNATNENAPIFKGEVEFKKQKEIGEKVEKTKAVKLSKDGFLF